MSIHKEVLSELKCCFLNDGHIAIEPILVSCGAIGCKECICSVKEELIECSNCNGKHKTKEFENAPVIIAFENIVKFFVSDLIQFAKLNLEKTTDLLKGIISRPT